MFVLKSNVNWYETRKGDSNLNTNESKKAYILARLIRQPDLVEHLEINEELLFGIHLFTGISGLFETEKREVDRQTETDK